MNFIRLMFAGSIATALLSVSATAQNEAEFQLLKKMNDAALAAPGLRITATKTDRDSGAVIETTVIEHTAPNRVHFVITRQGGPDSEMISDGTRSLSRSGPNEPWKPLPINLGQLFEQTQRSLSEENVRDQHGHIKLLGNDTVSGVAAKLYEVGDDQGTAKLWLAADNSRPLKLEKDATETIAPHGFKTDSKGMPDLKALRAQLQAAKVVHHLHTTMTYDYDPSLKIDMPAN